MVLRLMFGIFYFPPCRMVSLLIFVCIFQVRNSGRTSTYYSILEKICNKLFYLRCNFDYFCFKTSYIGAIYDLCIIVEKLKMWLLLPLFREVKAGVPCGLFRDDFNEDVSKHFWKKLICLIFRIYLPISWSNFNELLKYTKEKRVPILKLKFLTKER